MDKRTLVFIVTLSLSFFLVNLFFSYRDQQHRKEWLESEQTRKEQLQAKLADEVQARQLKAEELSETPLHKQKGSPQPDYAGMAFGQSVLLITQDQMAPEVLYDSAGAALTRLGEHVGSPSLLIYSKGGKLASAPFDPLLNGDLHFVTKTDAGWQIVLAEQRGGQVQWLLDLPKQDSLVLTKYRGNLLPLGFFSLKEERLTPLLELPEFASAVTLAEEAKSSSKAASPKEREQYFVLENGYQQLVFSNQGGALVEVNLPFQGPQHENSVVLSIQTDRKLVEQSPRNARFPLHAYATASADGSIQQHPEGTLGHYYPLLRRPLLTPDGAAVLPVPARHYALNVVSDFPEVAELRYEVKRFTDKEIVFEATQPHRRITKTYRLPPTEESAPYVLEASIRVDGDSRSLWLTSGVPEVEWISGGPAPLLQYRVTRRNKPEVEKLGLPKTSTTMSSVYPDWLANGNGFFGLILDPLDEAGAGFLAQRVAGEVSPSRLVLLDRDQQPHQTKDLPGYEFLLPLPDKGGELKFRLYAGPFADSVLKKVDSLYADPATGYTSDYIACQTFHGIFSFISRPFSKLLFVLITLFHRFTGSWAFSIILLTIVLKAMTYPLNAWSLRSMRRLQAVAPEVNALKEKYKKDPERQNKEIFNLYRERRVNPFTSCLPTVIQIPFLVGMFDLLKSTFELRGASFIPGWINDLAAPDVLFSWGFSLPIIGHELHLLPLLLGGIMFVQGRLSQWLSPTEGPLTDEQRQQKSMGTMTSIIFTFMFYKFPSGLNLYWLSSSALQILQQVFTNRQTDKELAEQKSTAPTPASKKKKARA